MCAIGRIIKFFFFTRFTCMYAYQKLTRRALLVLVTYLLTAASLVAEGPSFYSTRKGSSAVEHRRRSSESSRYRRVERAEKKGGHHLTPRVLVNADTRCACRILLLMITCSILRCAPASTLKHHGDWSGSTGPSSIIGRRTTFETCGHAVTMSSPLKSGIRIRNPRAAQRRLLATWRGRGIASSSRLWRRSPSCPRELRQGA